LDAAKERLEQEMHKVAELLYKADPTAGAEGAAPGAESADAGDGEEVIDAEYTEEQS
jgi:hypothetical protein